MNRKQRRLARLARTSRKQQQPRWHYHTLLSRIPVKNRTLKAFAIFMLVVMVYTYWKIHYTDKVAEFIGAAIAEHILFGE